MPGTNDIFGKNMFTPDGFFLREKKLKEIDDKDVPKRFRKLPPLTAREKKIRIDVEYEDAPSFFKKNPFEPSGKRGNF